MSLQHLTAIISVIRHGEKDTEGLLTDKGQQQAVIKGIKIPYLQGNVKLFHSGVGRVKKTAELVGRSIDATVERMATEPELITSLSADNEKILPSIEKNELHFAHGKDRTSPYFSSWKDISTEVEETYRRMQDYLNLKDQAPETGTPSPKELAAGLGTIILEEAAGEFATPYHTKANIVIVTHEPVIMSFLYYSLNQFLPGGTDFVSHIGGSVGFAEGFDIRLYQNEAGEKSFCFLEFRDLLEDFSLEKLQEFTSLSPIRH